MNPTAGLSFKPVHYEQAMACPAAGLWFEVHAENYMVDGGPRLAMLEALRERFPLSFHGVGLSLAGVDEPDRDHLARFKRLIDRFKPFLVSEHLAWSRFEQSSFPDLLPFPRTDEALDIITRNIDITQSVLGQKILIENPSLYMKLEGHEWPESLFLAELVRRTGCGLLIDVNNVFVSANNLGFNPASYLDALPSHAIGEIHLAGHSEDPLLGRSLLIDSHDAPISEEVWRLYDWLLARCGADHPPTLIERDDSIPEFDLLLAERDKAAGMMAGTRQVVHV
ncbi:DUF692 domain-containing protein [Sphingomonas sp.]|uniref:MNIO family bufferin maturase n=1 Tax=Sphingomonas sp. TaxID=28214 RepID=UPI0025E39B21|nr:DUF692 domain-containing protein [Sphingomonas sp.]